MGRKLSCQRGGSPSCGDTLRVEVRALRLRFGGTFGYSALHFKPKSSTSSTTHSMITISTYFHPRLLAAYRQIRVVELPSIIISLALLHSIANCSSLAKLGNSSFNPSGLRKTSRSVLGNCGSCATDHGCTDQANFRLRSLLTGRGYDDNTTSKRCVESFISRPSTSKRVAG